MDKIVEALAIKTKEVNLDQTFVQKLTDTLFDSNKFVKYSEIVEWIGYKKKDTVVDILKDKKYELVFGSDYNIVKMESTGGRPNNEIYMTVDTVKLLCMMAPTEKGHLFRKYYIELEKCFKKIISEHLHLQTNNTMNNPIKILNKYEFDPNQWKNKEVMYLIYIKDDIYKFGVTQNILKRFKTHKDKFNYEYVVKCWDTINRTVSKKIEDSVLLYVKHEKINHKMGNEKELIKTNDIDKMIKVMNGYVEKHTKMYKDQFKSVELEQQNEIIKNKLELIKQMNEFKKNNNNIDTQNLIGLFSENISNKSKQNQSILESLDNQNNQKEISDEYDNDILDDLDDSDNYDNSDDSDNEDLYDESVNESIDVADHDQSSNLRKCTRCKESHTEEEFGFNRKKKNISYLVCKICRNKLVTNESKLDEIINDSTTELRKCQRCDTPYTEEEFGLNAKNKPYMNCKECRAKQKISDSKRKNVDERKEKTKQYFAEHKEEIYAKKKANKVYKPIKVKQSAEELDQKRKIYYAKNQARILQNKKDYYEKNKENIRTKQKEYYDENASEIIYHKVTN